MKIKGIAITAALTAVGTAVALASATATQAGPKPGLLPGKWQGTGVISGSVTDRAGAATTTFSGKLGFRLIVDKKLNAEGTGSWVKTAKGRGLVSSTMTGIGRMTLDGTARDVFFLYSEDVEGTITANGITSPVKFQRGAGEEMLKSRLVITKARTCSAAGYIPVSNESGVKMTWTAKRLGCRG